MKNNKLYLELHFTAFSYPESDVPVNFISSSLSIPSYINKTSASPLSIGEEGFNIVKNFLRRRKRSVTAIKEFKRSMGTFVNPATSPNSPAEAEFRATFVAAQNIKPGKTISGNVHFSYNSVTVPFAGRSGLVVEPRLEVVNKTIEVIDSTILPNIVRINVTLEHTSASTGDAKFIEIEDGNSGLITSADKFIINPTGTLKQTPGTITKFNLNVPNLCELV